MAQDNNTPLYKIANTELLKYFKWGDKKKIADIFNISQRHLSRIISGQRKNKIILKTVYSLAHIRKNQHDQKLNQLKTEI